MRVDPRLGTEIAGHRVLEVIGRGGIAVVYLAEHLRLGRKVALKVLDPSLAEDQPFRERFIRESRIAAGLDHPNVVTVYDAGEAEGVLYISMRYVEGTDLERLLASEASLAPSRAVSIVQQSAGALDAAHAEGLVHRDVKPANILLEADRQSGAERVFLTDFGITKRVLSEAGLTRTGSFVGTVDYVAPEQIRGEEVDARADVYSLGCVLYRLLTGEVPFPRDTDVTTIYAHLEDPPPRPSERNPSLPVAFDEVIARALAKSRDERFGSCRELADAAGASIAPTAKTVEAPSRAGRRHRKTALLAAVFAVVLLVGIGGALLLSTRDGSPSPPAGGQLSRLQLAWTRVPPRERVFGGERSQDIVRSVATSTGIIGVGHDESGGDEDAAVWVSPNGKRWKRVLSSDALGGPGAQGMNGVTVFGDEVVAVGFDSSGGDEDAAVWTSADDGMTWTSAGELGLREPGDQEMRRVIAAPPGLVAVGYDASAGNRVAAVWTSADGLRWSPVPSAGFGGTGDQEMFGIATLGEKLVAVGYGRTELGDEDAAVWIGSGDTWSRVTSDSLGGPGDQQITSLLAGGPGLVAVGYDTSGGDYDAAVWTSSDGSIWERVPTDDSVFGGSGNQRIYAIAEAGQDFVAGGSSDTPQGDSDGAIWLSSDGTHWTRASRTVVSMSALVGLGQQRVKSLVVFDNMLVAAGSEVRARDDDAAVWFALLPAAKSP